MQELLSPEFYKIIIGNSLFCELSTADYEFAMQFFETSISTYKKGEFLSRIGSGLSAFGMVLSGSVQVFMDDYDGQPIMMANVNVGDTFGESLCFLEREAQVYICASTDATVLWMRTNQIKSASSFRNACAVKLANRFTGLLAFRALSMNDRIQILSKLTLRDKLITYFSQLKMRTGSYTFIVPLNRNDMAVYLGTNRSALSRELARMASEGIIEYHRNQFTIHCNLF